MKNHEIAHRLAVDAMNDYCAARLLVREEFILNSIQLACTAVEKLLKAFLYVQSDSKIRFDHDPSKIFKNNKETFEKHFNLNIEFLKWLGKVYGSRYTSDYGKRKEIQFGEKHFLAELDFTFFQIFSFFKVTNLTFSDVYFSDHRSQIKKYENFIIQNRSKEEFKCEPQRFFVFQLFGVEHLDITMELKAFNPERPFVFKDSVIENGNSVLEVDFGNITLK